MLFYKFDRILITHFVPFHIKSLISVGWFGWWFMVFNATFNNISVRWWRSVLLLEETGVPGENHRLVASHLQTLWHNVVSSLFRTKCSETYHYTL